MLTYELFRDKCYKKACFKMQTRGKQEMEITARYIISYLTAYDKFVPNSFKEAVNISKWPPPVPPFLVF